MVDVDPAIASLSANQEGEAIRSTATPESSVPDG